MLKGVKAFIPTWAALGFYRGAKLYNWDYKNESISYEKIKNNKYYIETKKPQYLYSGCITYGFIGLFVYITPTEKKNKTKI